MKICAAAAGSADCADRASDHDVVGPRRDCLLWRGHPRLVAGLAAGQADARGHNRHVRPDNCAHAGGLVAGGHHSVATRIAGEGGAAHDEIGGRGVDALLAQIARIEVGKHGDAEHLETGAGPARNCRAQRLAVLGVNGEERRSTRGGIADRTRHGVLDVEQLHVEEDAGTLSRQLTRELESARHHQLEADLVERHRRPQPRNERPRTLDRRYVERDDQPVARRDAGQGTGLLSP